MTRPPKDLGASVQAKLRNLAQQRGDDVQHSECTTKSAPPPGNTFVRVLGQHAQVKPLLRSFTEGH